MISEASVEWVSPESFPDLRREKYISIDLETKDPNLTTRGSGALVDDGKIIGVAVAVPGWKGYYAFGHDKGNYFDEHRVMGWVKDVCALPATKIFHNAMYDICWLSAYGVQVKGRIVDTMVMASLIDENRFSYALNSVSHDYLHEIKDESVLKLEAKNQGVNAKSEMYKLPAMYVGSYAEQDAELTLKLFNKLELEIKNKDLSKIFELETELFPCLIDMKVRGVRVDVQKAHKLKQQLASEEKQLLLEIKKETSIDTQIWAARSIATVFDKL